jgi:tetratricopeptide (TPR) repeat protein
MPALRVPGWAYAGGPVVLAALSFWGLFYSHQWPIDELIASAYTEQRTMELRIPKAAYGPVRLIRGSANRSRLERPRALLEGEARIARELAKDPTNPALLQAMGRTDLLDWNYDAAIASFEQALKARPDSPSLMTDLASAYFERVEANHQATGYGAAAEFLSRALRASRDDPVALFNRAIVYERMRLYDQAIEDWQRYLRVDPDGSWTSEATKRAADVEQSKKEYADWLMPRIVTGEAQEFSLVPSLKYPAGLAVPASRTPAKDHICILPERK